jgi:peptidoglycan/xylan/chitin deacetylase (PgdA/CDA1 family)
MRSIFGIVKLLAALSLHQTGLLRVILEKRLRNQSLVLTYHRVIDDERAPLTNSHRGIIVSDDIFEKHMRTLRQRFNPISLHELQAHMEQSTNLPERSCLVTFDDGWLDNYEIAFPILQKYEIPAVIFLPVNYVSGDSMFWQEEIRMMLTRMLSSDDEKQLAKLIKILEPERTFRKPTKEDIRSYVAKLKNLSDAEIDLALELVRGEFGSHDESPHYNRYLTWEQILEMQAAGITFASHAQSHRRLCGLSDAQCRTELVTSRTILEERLGHPVRAIAYPNGDYDERVMKEAKKAGYSMAFSTRGGFVQQSCNSLAIPRNNIHNDNAGTEAQFMCACARLF